MLTVRLSQARNGVPAPFEDPARAVGANPPDNYERYMPCERITVRAPGAVVRAAPVAQRRRPGRRVRLHRSRPSGSRRLTRGNPQRPSRSAAVPASCQHPACTVSAADSAAHAIQPAPYVAAAGALAAEWDVPLTENRVKRATESGQLPRFIVCAKHRPGRRSSEDPTGSARAARVRVQFQVRSRGSATRWSPFQSATACLALRPFCASRVRAAGLRDRIENWLSARSPC